MSGIEMHSSWLAINSIVGYPNGCKHCLLQTNNNNNCFPKQFATLEESVKQLLEYKYYGKDIEPKISEEIIKENFKKLSENGIDIIHYYKPFLPQNSDPKRIKEILDYVNQYTNIS